MAILFGPASFALVRGTKWEDDFILTNASTGAAIDLTGITGMTMRIRRAIGTAILLELSIANGLLVVVDAAAGRVGIRVPTDSTIDFPENGHRKAKYVYDAVIERTAGEYEAGAKGKVTVHPQITRPWAAT